MKLSFLVVAVLAGAMPLRAEKVPAFPSALEALQRQGCDISLERDNVKTQVRGTIDPVRRQRLEKRVAKLEGDLSLARLRFTKGGGRNFELPDCKPPLKK